MPVQEQPEERGWFPFCSEQCRLIDLGSWLDAEYRIIQELNSDNPAESLDGSSDITDDNG